MFRCEKPLWIRSQACFQNQIKIQYINLYKMWKSAQLPFGRSPLSQASSFLLSSTCSSAACSLCGRMESSSSNCADGARPTRKNNQNTVLPLILTNLLPWSWICCVQLLPAAGNDCWPGRQLAPVETSNRADKVSLYNLLELFWGLIKTTIGHGPKKCQTSSMGSSLSRGSELERRPTMKGVGVQTMSSMAGGSTGMYVCCQVKG